MKLRKVTQTLINFFQSQGIKVMRYDAYSTNSIYLKLDYGLLYSIRLSDHQGKEHLNYRFNVIMHYEGPKYVATEYSWRREFYDLKPDDLNNLCIRILQIRSQRLLELGLYGYQHAMDHRKQENMGNKGFWKQAKDLG
ncbi:hypothetical protein [Lentilactobacillus sp. SPB1-3]|uniref:Uncharacterized protein n=1 Tax=Lentilactobacillus terminaliae TaxID=3003483 RepID=A0ACD5DCL8_9LACO|nr:hypothetical protein [Lentilactobacillus sp. SPB1-3]MCZ0978063.1 hypothetical protein [Lentilactobacillus sp. SPB1-3]